VVVATAAPPAIPVASPIASRAPMVVRMRWLPMALNGEGSIIDGKRRIC